MNLRPPLRTLALTALVAGAWFALVHLALLPLIGAVVERRGPAWAQRLTATESPQAAEERLSNWRRRLTGVGVLILAGGAGVSLLQSPGVRRRIDRCLPPPRDADPRMTPRRMRLASAFIVSLLGLQLLAIASGYELWPISPHAMYSNVHRPHMQLEQVWAVTDEGEFELDPRRQAPPFDRARLRQAVPKARGRGHSGEALLADLAKLYERARERDQKALPPLKGLKLYRVEIDVVPGVAPAPPPEKYELLAELDLRAIVPEALTSTEDEPEVVEELFELPTEESDDPGEVGEAS